MLDPGSSEWGQGSNPHPLSFLHAFWFYILISTLPSFYPHKKTKNKQTKKKTLNVCTLGLCIQPRYSNNDQIYTPTYNICKSTQNVWKEFQRHEIVRKGKEEQYSMRHRKQMMCVMNGFAYWLEWFSSLITVNQSTAQQKSWFEEMELSIKEGQKSQNA